MRHLFTGVCLTALLLCAGVSSTRVAAQAAPTAAAPTTAARTVWNGAYSAEQAARGRDAYAQHCQRCHVFDEAGRPTRFIGDRFWRRFGDDTLDGLFLPIRTNMPNNQPGTLAVPTYLDIVAFLLQQNDMPTGAAELTEQDLPSIQLVSRDGPAPIAADSLVAISGCLVQEGAEWRVTNASAPIRLRAAGAPVDQARLGAAGKTFALKYLLVPPTRMKGQWVTVRGLMMSTGDAVNVSLINAVQPACPN